MRAYEEAFQPCGPTRGADPAHAGGPPTPGAVPQRPEHAVHAPRPPGSAHRQRERHGGRARDPVRRQRHALGPGGAPRPGGPPGDPDRHRGGVHRRPAPRSRGAADSRGAAPGCHHVILRRGHRERGQHRRDELQGPGGPARRDGGHSHRGRQRSDPGVRWRRSCTAEEVGTLFIPSRSRMQSRKRWLAFASLPRGGIVVDAGARAALVRGGKSLLPSGIRGTQRSFRAGDVVSLLDPAGREFGRGLANYSRDEVEKIKGLHSNEIVGALGGKSVRRGRAPGQPRHPRVAGGRNGGIFRRRRPGGASRAVGGVTHERV